MNQTEKATAETGGTGFHKFAWIRIIAGVLIAIGLIWGIIFILDRLGPDDQAPAPPAVSSRSAPAEEPGAADSHAPAQPATAPSHGEAASPADPHGSPGVAGGATGVAFVEAITGPLSHELDERFWGWRPNDIVNFTDNVNNFQLGVLEVTRRAATRLTDNISRTGSTASLNPHLERAMNLLMINANSYMLPSAESEYREAINALHMYKRQLADNRASFYTRPDNLIPLLRSFEELLGSCDENLVKIQEGGEPVSTFKADDYFYYAKGVASALAVILPAISVDFQRVLDVRSGDEILHHAAMSCEIAGSLEPWLWVTEASLNGIFANHRANMAAHISHARFYVGLLAEAIST